MGLLDKLKNVFFEEEYVEVEEPVKKEKTTIAKKVETPELKREAYPEESSIIKPKDENRENIFEDEDFEIKEPEKDFKFPMNFDDNDFEVEKTIEFDEPVKELQSRITETEEKVEEPVYEEPVIYKEETITRTTTEYQEPIRETREQRTSMYQGLYGKSDDLKLTMNMIDEATGKEYDSFIFPDDLEDEENTETE